MAIHLSAVLVDETDEIVVYRREDTDPPHRILVDKKNGQPIQGEEALGYFDRRIASLAYRKYMESGDQRWPRGVAQQS
jgi:hypothetical protein